MQQGLEHLSIGGLAAATGMSKSGVFAHFGSREEMQLAVIHEYHQQFAQAVFFPALQAPRGLPRLRTLFANWIQRTCAELDSGCIYISGAVEFNRCESAVRDALAASVQTWHTALHRTIEQCKTCGHLPAQADARQMLFELHGLILALHYETRFLRTPALPRAWAGFERLLAFHGATDQAATAPATTHPPSTPRTEGD